MKLIRQKTFSKMSKKTFEKKESEITNKYKKGLGHTAGAGINAAVGVSLAKHAKNSKLAAAGTAVSAANAGYHAYNAGKNFKEGFKIARDPKYQEKLDEAIKIQNRKDDKELEKLQKAEEIVKAQKKKLHLYSDQEEQKEFSEKSEERKNLEKEYKKESKKIQDAIGKGTEEGTAVGMAGALGALGYAHGKDAKRDSEIKQLLRETDKAIANPKRIKDVDKINRAVKRAGRKTVAKHALVGAGIGYVAGKGVGKLNSKLTKRQIEKGDKKFLKNATDEEIKKALQQIKD